MVTKLAEFTVFSEKNCQMTLLTYISNLKLYEITTAAFHKGFCPLNCQKNLIFTVDGKSTTFCM